MSPEPGRFKPADSTRAGGGAAGSGADEAALSGGGWETGGGGCGLAVFVTGPGLGRGLGLGLGLGLGFELVLAARGVREERLSFLAIAGRGGRCVPDASRAASASYCLYGNDRNCSEERNCTGKGPNGSQGEPLLVFSVTGSTLTNKGAY